MSGADVCFAAVSKRYGSTIALSAVDAFIAHGESVAVMGPSGSGKTTLALAAAGVIVPDAGEVSIGSTIISALSEEQRTGFRLANIGLVFQAGHLLGDVPLEENIALPLMFSGISRNKAVGEARRWLSPLGLDGLGDRRPGQVSGGQAQRAAIARALIGRPSVIIADEPTGALDQETGAAVMALLVSMTRSLGSTLIIVTHDSTVAGACERRLEVIDGRIVADQSRRGERRECREIV